MTAGQIALVVEEAAPGASVTAVNRRVLQFLRNGVQRVWVLDPETRSVAIFPSGSHLTVFDERDEPPDGTVLPELGCRVAELFAPPAGTGGEG